MNRVKLIFLFLSTIIVLFSCVKTSAEQNYIEREIVEISEERHETAEDPVIRDLAVILNQDRYLWILVDKIHSLPADYEPNDLTTLESTYYRTGGRTDLRLRREASDSLREMGIAAMEDGIILTITSTYRSYAYQDQLYSRYVNERGVREADRISARPGHSQHQLGLVVDFGNLTESFALTPEGIWLSNNASRFGWSLSYPRGYEEITGYTWEPWHYRYVGRELAEFINKYFNGIQQNALVFIHEQVN